MDKWEKQLNNDVNLSVPSIIDKRVEETLKQLPRKKTKKKVFIGLTVAMVALSMVIGLSVISPTFANTMKEIPVIGSAFEFIGDIDVKKGKIEGLTIELGEQIEIDGQLITFTETLYDGGQIHIGYIIQENESNRTPFFLDNLELLINGKKVGYGMGRKELEIENGMYAGTISVHVREEIPDSFVLGIRSNKGKSWFVELAVEKKGEYQSFLINQIKKNEELTVIYDKITFFPTSTEISFRLMYDDKVNTDNKFLMLNYQVIDDKGRVLQPFSSGGKSGQSVNGKVIFHYEQYNEAMQTIPTTLTIKPYFSNSSEIKPQIKKIKWEGEKMTLPQGEIGHLTILESTVENGVRTFRYKVEGEDLYSQANAIWLEDSSGTRYYSEQPAVRVDGSINQYQASFSETPTSKDLYITTVAMSSPNFLEEFEVTISLKE
ncbi:DUF4179 domain-containing protein [Cytobacillus massiliigabonensis]|uniref:DUF4179 domain-containing protein n=1 Tax=Cytobacillus massiliigabonensis TaxID=1871011 RepID=UPI000C849221|nr:DUF4179 domain-containing protein [Cytobacillus massiliigabonensis]